MKQHTKLKTGYILIALLLLPYTYQLEHNHEHHHNYHHESGNSNNSFEENCFVCDFQYSAFLHSDQRIETSASTFYNYLINLYDPLPYTENNGYIFLLRAPPALQTA